MPGNSGGIAAAQIARAPADGYALMLAAASYLPVTLGMSGALYGVAVSALNAMFVAQAWRLLRDPAPGTGAG